MSNFKCDQCGTVCIDSPRGYISGCEHHKPYKRVMKGFGFVLDAGGIPRKWAVDNYGTRRFIDNNEQVIK